MTKTAFIAIVGKPNVGKSSLLNKMIGAKVAIVSSKPQTTRTKIMGVLTLGETQFVFTDTPGFHKPHNKLSEHMNDAVGDSIAGTDAVLFVAEPRGELNEKELELINRFGQEKIPVILAINKIDTVKDKKELLERIVYLNKFYDFFAVVPVSAVQGNGINELLDEMKKIASESVHFFPDDALTDQPERVLAAEIIREKILRLMDKEIPHGIAVSVEKMRERSDKQILDVDSVIYCERETHKGMIIGKNGAMLKKISTLARIDLEKFFGIKVNLHTWVKVKEGWRNKEGLIHNFGLD
ncbi:MAG: GTPase Era [Clostridiales bacterium]|nr:GTPase Era [Clostridiales bacterium]